VSDRALDDMRARKPWPEIKKRNKDGSIYRALEKFQPEMEKNYSEAWKNLDKINDETKIARTKKTEAETKRRQLDSANQKLQQHQSELTARNSDLEKKIESNGHLLRETESKLENRLEKLKQLDERGLTEEFARAHLGLEQGKRSLNRNYPEGIAFIWLRKINLCVKILSFVKMTKKRLDVLDISKACEYDTVPMSILSKRLMLLYSERRQR
jgi:hypothetical protein